VRTVYQYVPPERLPPGEEDGCRPEDFESVLCDAVEAFERDEREAGRVPPENLSPSREEAVDFELILRGAIEASDKEKGRLIENGRDRT
jgi:hypothetical protein